METSKVGWLDHLKQQRVAYIVLVSVTVALFGLGLFYKSSTPAKYVVFALGSGVLGLLIFLLISPHDVAWLENVRQHRLRYSSLFVTGAGLLVVANLFATGGAQQVLYSLGAGLVGLLLFQGFTDYNNAKFICQVLDGHQISFHVGARLYPSHRNVMSRAEAVRKFLGAGDTIRFVTSTADDYVLPQRETYDALLAKLHSGLKMQILLYTPIYNLKSYLDYHKPATNSPSGVDDGQRHGQHHYHASKLVNFQRETIIPAIRDLMEAFPKQQVEARFFHIQHHVNMVVYGTRRIFAAPFLVGAEGLNLPCLEVFPGLSDTVLFDKMLAEFQYIWDKPKLTISLDHMEKIYAYIAEKYKGYIVDHWIEPEDANKIEEYARSLVDPSFAAPISDQIETRPSSRPVSAQTTTTSQMPAS